MTLLQMSLSGGCIILTTILLRALALHRLPKRMLLMLWELAVLRLLLPLRMTSRWSVFALFSGTAQRASEATIRRAVQSGEAISRTPEAAGASWLSILWLTGAILCGLVLVLAWLRSAIRFRTAKPVRSEFIEAWLREHPLRRSLRVRCSRWIDVPLTYGLLRPVILLPERLPDEASVLERILYHEWIHIRRFDVLRKALLAAAACVHWFNPLVWIMLTLANRDIELACDEQVLRAYPDRRTYAMALLGMEEVRSPAVPLANYFSKNAIEERITAIMKIRNKSILSIVLAFLLLMIAAVAFATTAPADEAAVDYAQYEAFGLEYDEAEGCLYYQGQSVRYFEDLRPADEEGKYTGVVYSSADGEVCVRIVYSDGAMSGVEYLPEGGEIMLYGKRTEIVFEEDGTVKYLESEPEIAYEITAPETDGPTSVFIATGDGQYTFAVNGETGDSQIAYSLAQITELIESMDFETGSYLSADED